ncbi:hypothetical protein EYF80_008406 [Liparis tanakae]|uniref:Uncharacterized protein n=1 Tax=Liparis tanakae TaxID=230148 RepID=A0A4Z2ITN9_9TELE|nr:hypothetical protein EYF80_008406 [Liparis tanakae]
MEPVGVQMKAQQAAHACKSPRGDGAYLVVVDVELLEIGEVSEAVVWQLADLVDWGVNHGRISQTHKCGHSLPNTGARNSPIHSQSRGGNCCEAGAIVSALPAHAKLRRERASVLEKALERTAGDALILQKGKRCMRRTASSDEQLPGAGKVLSEDEMLSKMQYLRTAPLFTLRSPKALHPSGLLRRPDGTLSAAAFHIHEMKFDPATSGGLTSNLEPLGHQ